MTSSIWDAIFLSINRGVILASSFIPNFIAGIIILLIGVILASIVKKIVTQLSNALKIESYLKQYGVPEARKEFTWTNILSEIARWFVIVIFLIPTAEVWGLPQVTTILNTFLVYLPNVFVAAIIVLIGFVAAGLVHDVVLVSASKLSAQSSQAIASLAKWAIVVFMLLAALTQLGIAKDLIQILFTGFVVMIALAGGIAFGLGGQDTAKDILETIRKKLK
ncbi:MAG: hypothetical protein HYT11_01055 [Candidatus Levybacteria bacterium]|nr:hypothetical protein [Candidatus Levybacteria bacterium]